MRADGPDRPSSSYGCITRDLKMNSRMLGGPGVSVRGLCPLPGVDALVHVRAALFVPNHRSLQNTHEEPLCDICPTPLCSVDDCAKSEIAYCPYGPVRGPGTTFQPRTGPYGQYAISDLSQSAFKMHTQVAAGALIFIFRQS